MTLILAAYDVNTKTAAGRRRLRRMAKICTSYGQPVQKSLFECWVDPVTWIRFRAAVLSEYISESDSFRFYHLGDNWKGRVEHYGAKEAYDPKGPSLYDLARR